MALTTHEQIRVEAGFQSEFVRQPFKNSPNGVNTTFFVSSDDNIKIVPNFGTGSTVAGVSDVQVYLGLSGINGVSRLNVTSIDIEQGSITLSSAPATGVSLIVNYASSTLPSNRIESMRLQAENIINSRLSICYTLPISPTPSVLSSYAARLASALLLIRGYGKGSRSTASDGYALYSILMGNNQALINQGSDSEAVEVGEIGLICSPNYQLVDDDGNVIPRADSGAVGGDDNFLVGGRVGGRIYDITEEPFRFKESQRDADREQSGSGLYSP